MDKFGITKEGFKKRDLNSIKEKFVELIKAQPAFGQDIDLSEKDAFSQLNFPHLYLISELWEVAEHCFYSTSPKFSEGNVLKAKGKYIGIKAKQGNKATGVLTIEGEKGTEVSKGYKVGTEDGVTFITLDTKIISESGTIDVKIVAEEKGEQGNVPSQTITKTFKSILGIEKVYNKNKTENGENPESDIEFRERYNKSASLRATNTFDSIRAKVAEVAGVRDAFVHVNQTMQEKDGIPPKSFHVIVFGGEDEAVAKAIFEKYPGGIEPFGNTKVEVTDSKKQKHLIGFSRPTFKEIYLKLKINKNDSFPTNGEKEIKTILKQYFDMFKIGQNVILYKIITAIDKAGIKGIEDIEISVSVDGKSYNNNNITVADLEVATTTLEKIEVI